MSEDFLSRWARLKDEARRAAQAPPDSPRPADAPASPQEEPREAALSPDEIAALPKIEELTAESDVTVFLRRGVPDALRKSALRRAWMVDPAIRDFVGHARDYSYDWNTPGGAPGHGALEPGDDVAAMVRRILGEPAPHKPASQPPVDEIASAETGDTPPPETKT
jgi:hypothetical protein